MTSGKPFKGSARRLTLAFDVGTTYSGASYCLLDPGEVPKICTVTRCVHMSISYTAIAPFKIPFVRVALDTPGKNMQLDQQRYQLSYTMIRKELCVVLGPRLN